MTSHDLAKILLANEDLPIATHANNHTYASKSDVISDHCKVAILEHYTGRHIIIGNFSRKELNGQNEYITDVIHGSDIPKNWPTVEYRTGVVFKHDL